MRALAALVIVAIPAVAAAQSSAASGGQPASLPRIGLPLPAIGLPLPRIGLPAEEPRVLGVPPQGPPNGPHVSRRRSARPPAAVFFLIPPYDWDRPERRVHRTRPAQAREKKGDAGAENSRDQPYTTGAAAPQDPPDATAPVPRTTVYFIPGCYLGNIPPKDAKLPATCDQSATQTFEP